MRGQDNQQAYDRGSAMFSPDGRIYQVEYAHEAVSQGSPSVAIRAGDGVVLAVRRRLRSPLLEGAGVEKIHKVDDHIGIATTGHVADGRQLVEAARQAAQVHRLRYEEPVRVEMLTKTLTDHIQEYTQTGGTRPFGVSLLVAGVDSAPRLYEADPSGNPAAWKARAVGEGARDIQESIEAEYTEDLTLEDAIRLAVDALGAESDDGELSPDSLGLAVVERDTGLFRRLTDDEVQNYLPNPEN